MGLVDYSESDSSDTEAPSAKATPAKRALAPNAKKPFQKVVDRSNPGKILVSLPQVSAETGDEQQPPPAKRARTAGAGGGGGKFSGFNSFLPAPKNPNKLAASRPSASAPSSSSSSSSSFSAPKVGINFKTSAAPGFSRDNDDGGKEGPSRAGPPAVRGNTQPAFPSVPDDQKPAEEVKLVGKPLMFKPLSISRGTTTKKKNKQPLSSPAAVQPATTGPQKNLDPTVVSAAPAPKKVSLFSMHLEEEAPVGPAQSTGSYEPMFGAEAEAGPTTEPAPYAGHEFPVAAEPESLDMIADDLHLSAAERRELFGRGGANMAARRVVNFNMDKEYQHNEGIRAQGDQQMHNPVRAIQGGKHSLRQLVQNVHNQREALEESFAKGKSNRKEASSKYGW